MSKVSIGLISLRLPIANMPVRLTPGHGYLEALASDNVIVRNDEIARITPTGIEMADGTHFTLDAIICATGFDNSYRPSFAVIGEDGKDLRDEWKDGPRSYLSVAVAGYPNYFSTYLQ
jgi:cation diffusion facilitator CzcD-associated flavoprotein CzcO